MSLQEDQLPLELQGVSQSALEVRYSSEAFISVLEANIVDRCIGLVICRISYLEYQASHGFSKLKNCIYGNLAVCGIFLHSYLSLIHVKETLASFFSVVVMLAWGSHVL